ncbi:MAG: DUF1326 domain-containing protein [Isosphaeraceae bacterium]
MRTSLSACFGTLLILGTSFASAADIQGDYVEARTADVFTGPCISNSEVFITGHQAVMAWKVEKGTWKGTDISGLCVAAAVRGTTTFSEDQPERAACVLILDAKANASQRDALRRMAQELGGARLKHVVAVKTARMSLKLEDHATSAADATHSAHGMPHSPRASFWAAGLAQIVTRPLDDSDHFCGNEVVAYPPLSSGVKAAPAYTLGHEFKGQELDTRWNDPNCRSSFVGRFAL